MIQVGRFHKVRAYGPVGISPAYVLAQKRAQWPASLMRYRQEDWAYDQASGLVIPAISGGVGAKQAGIDSLLQGYWAYQSFGTTQTTQALNSAYTYNSAGAAIAGRYLSCRAKTLDSVYFFITAIGGTQANVNDINVEVRNDSGAAKPGSSLLASGSVDPASTTGWKKVSGLALALSAGTFYWPVIGDADGNATDFATVLKNIATGVANEQLRYDATSATNGFSTNPAIGGIVPSMVLAHTDGFVVGQPITASANPASNTNRRGFRFSEGLTADGAIFGLVGNLTTNLSSATGIELWLDNTGPSGTAFATGTVPLRATTGSGTAGYTFTTPIRLRARMPFRLVMTFSAGSTSIPRLQIGTGSDQTLRNARWGNGTVYWGQANGTTNWSNDNQDEMPTASVLMDDAWDAYDGSGIGLSRFGSGRQKVFGP